MNRLVKFSVVHTCKPECAKYYAIDPVNEMMVCIQVNNIAMHAAVNTHVVHVNEFAATPVTLEFRNDFNDVQLNDHVIQSFCAHNCVTMYSMEGHNSLAIFKKPHVSVWRNPTTQYDVADYYESLNANLRLVLLARVSKCLRDP